MSWNFIYPLCLGRTQAPSKVSLVFLKKLLVSLFIFLIFPSNAALPGCPPFFIINIFLAVQNLPSKVRIQKLPL